MIKATEVMEDFKITQGLDATEDDDIVSEEIIKLYLVLRLRPLVGIAGINENRLNNICDFLTDNYFDYNISIDLMCNAVYNYINATKNCPSDYLLRDDIEALIEEYGINEELIEECKWIKKIGKKYQ